MKPLGTLYGLGVGPGDPELLTLKAARILGEVDVVFTSAQASTGKSLALEVARPHLRKSQEIVPVFFSHTFEGAASREAHRANAVRVLEVLSRPASAAFLTLGDPMTYSTFTYLLAALRAQEPGVPVAVVPGITSFAAAAAAAQIPLTEGNETLAVVSGARGPERVESALGLAENVVILKSYRHAEEICQLLDARGLADSTIYSIACSRPEGFTVQGLDAVPRDANPYMSLFVVKGAGPTVGTP
jgi:precorrin-2/cobalt-factor-2 C20-methyltransferase